MNRITSVILSITNTIKQEIKLRIEQELIVLRYIIYLKPGKRTVIVVSLRLLLLSLGVGLFFTIQSAFTADFSPFVNVLLISLFAYLLLKAIWTLGYTINRIKSFGLWAILIAGLQLSIVFSVNYAAEISNKFQLTNAYFQALIPGYKIDNSRYSLSSISISSIDINGASGNGINFVSIEDSIAISEGNTEAKLLSKALVYPNPMSWSQDGEASIGFKTSKEMNIDVRLYDMRAHQIYQETVIANGYKKVPINTTTLGQELPSGVYFFVVMYEGEVLDKGKMAVVP